MEYLAIVLAMSAVFALILHNLHQHYEDLLLVKDFTTFLTYRKARQLGDNTCYSEYYNEAWLMMKRYKEQLP